MLSRVHDWRWFYGAKTYGGEMRRCGRCGGFRVVQDRNGERVVWLRRNTQTQWTEGGWIYCDPKELEAPRG